MINWKKLYLNSELKFHFITLKRCIVALSFLFIYNYSIGQGRQVVEDLYRDANAYFYFEDYEEALALYLEVYNSYADNSNLDYRIGISYLNIPGSRHKAIPYLERASKNISRRYSETSIRETRAPVDALFYLGNAYFINNQLDKAREAYNNFLSQIRSDRQYDLDYLNHQIAGLDRSRVIQRYPVNFIRKNLGDNINNRFPNFNAVIAGDGKTLAYTTKERFYQAIMVARKDGDRWGRPQNITLDLVVDGNASTLSLSYKGDELYLFKDVDHVGNIYVSQFRNGAWSPMQKLNPNINTEAYETHASVSSDGKKLFFASNRPGGFGDLDLYVSEITSNGDWGPAVNLGPNINTRFNENSPFITVDGNTLFFSSEGHNSMGGYDIFFSTRQSDGTWSKPVNLGYPINTTDDDIFYYPIGDGSQGLMAVFDPKGYGEKDITQIEIFLPRYQRSVVTLEDFYTRRSELPQKTLVVDTVNIKGIALLDPSRTVNLGYLDSDYKYTLFFGGKPFEVRDQTTARQALTARLTPTKKIDDISIVIPPRLETDTLSELIENLIDRGIRQAELDKVKASEAESVQTEKVTDTTSGVDFYSLEQQRLTSQEPTKESLRLAKILSRLANPSIKPSLSDAMQRNWELPTALLKIEAKRLAHIADSLNQLENYIALYSKMLDIVSIKSVESVHRQSRQIAQTSFDEDFFFRLQKIKRMASPGLALLLDEAILTQPKIATFTTLWEYLLTERKEQIEPYLKEFLELLIEAGVDGYFNLSESNKDELSRKIGQKYTPITGIAVVSILSIIVFILLIAFLKRRRLK